MRSEVLIVGAGPTGLMLACELARRGIQHRVIERGAGPAAGSRGKGVQPRTLEIFEAIGIANDLIGGGRFGVPLQIHHADGTKVVETLAEPRDGTSYGSTLLTPQWRVETCLRHRLHELGGRVEWGTAVVDFEDLGDRVSARVRSGDKTETITASWLVGCDGGQSTVRKSLGIPFTGETLDHVRMWVGDVQVEGLDREYWHMWHDEQGFIALCPLKGTPDFQFQAQISPDEARQPSLDAFQEMMQERTARKDIRLTGAGWISSWRANVRMVDRFRVGRVLLAGDAAHVHSPAGAQGMNTGVQDAYNLAWKLAAVVDGGPDSLIDTYEEERLPIAQWVLGISSELTRTAFSPSLRRDERTMQLDLNYRASSLSVEAALAGATIRAGDRAPDATGLLGTHGRIARLFDLMRGTQATVLSFGRHGSELREHLAARYGAGVRVVNVAPADGAEPGDWIDGEGAAGRLYRPVADALFVLRPDGYIGLTGTAADLNDVGRYLDVLLGRALEGA